MYRDLAISEIFVSLVYKSNLYCYEKDYFLHMDYGKHYFLNLLQAQNVTITDDETHTADTSAILDLKSENKGFLIPRLTTTQILNINNPANGLLVFNSEEEKFYYFAGGSWIKLTAGNPDNIWQQKPVEMVQQP